MSARSKSALVLSVVLTGAICAAVAFAQERRADSVPRGPKVNFCPTQAQAEEHLRVYGFDYKPTVACSRDGEVIPPSQPQQRSADDSLTQEQACRRDKSLLESATPMPDRDGDATTIEGKLPDGRDVVVSVLGKVKPRWTIRDEAKVLPC